MMQEEIKEDYKQESRYSSNAPKIKKSKTKTYKKSKNSLIDEETKHDEEIQKQV
jgi:hypothetical protein